MASIVTTYVAFLMNISPKKFASIQEGAKYDIEKTTKQVLAKLDWGTVEFDAGLINSLTTKVEKQKSTYVDIIKKQMGWIKKDVEKSSSTPLLVLVKNTSSSLKKFVKWTKDLWEENEIPYTMKDGSYRLKFTNSGDKLVDPTFLGKSGFAKKAGNLYVYDGEKHMEEKNEVKKSNVKEKTPAKEKTTQAQQLETLTKNITKYLRENLKEGVLNIRDIDVAKALGVELNKSFMKKLQTMLDEKFSTTLRSDEDGVTLTVWKKSKKKIPVAGMK